MHDHLKAKKGPKFKRSKGDQVDFGLLGRRGKPPKRGSARREFSDDLMGFLDDAAQKRLSDLRELRELELVQGWSEEDLFGSDMED